jgi:hypothetical protein
MPINLENNGKKTIFVTIYNIYNKVYEEEYRFRTFVRGADGTGPDAALG